MLVVAREIKWRGVSLLTVGEGSGFPTVEDRTGSEEEGNEGT